MGSHSLTAKGFPGYNAFPPESGKSIAKHLQKSGFVNYAIGKWGGPNTYPHFHAGWALAGNNPFQYFKQFVHRVGIQDALDYKLDLTF